MVIMTLRGVLKVTTNNIYINSVAIALNETILWEMQINVVYV